MNTKLSVSVTQSGNLAAFALMHFRKLYSPLHPAAACQEIVAALKSTFITTKCYYCIAYWVQLIQMTHKVGISPLETQAVKPHS